MDPPNPMQDWLNAREFLRTHDVPCPHCSYNLRGNDTGKCPECGHDFDMIAIAACDSPGLSLPEILTQPWVQYPILAINAAAWIAVRVVGHSLSGQAASFAFSVAVLVALATWRGADRPVDEPLGSRAPGSLLSLLVDFFGFGFARYEAMVLWAFVAAVFLTGAHFVYACIVLTR